jgi:endonuclease-3 related protein
MFMDHLPARVGLFQEYHALLVRLGKEFCRPRPKCAECLLLDWPSPGE